MDKIYLLIINDDGDVIKLSELSKDEHEAACNGFVTIIDITTPSKPLLLTYYDEDDYVWKSVE